MAATVAPVAEGRIPRYSSGLGRTRASELEAAYELFSQRGFQAVGVDDYRALRSRQGQPLPLEDHISPIKRHLSGH
jgi:hypothetical protein